MKIATVITLTLQQRLAQQLAAKTQLEYQLEQIKEDIKGEIIANGGERIVVRDVEITDKTTGAVTIEARTVSLDAMPGRTSLDKDALKLELVKRGVPTGDILEAMAAASKTGDGFSQLNTPKTSKKDLKETA